MYDISGFSYVFDAIISKVKKELWEMYDKKALTKNDLANILSSVLPVAINEAMNAPIKTIQLLEERERLKALKEEVKLKAIDVAIAKENKDLSALQVEEAKRKLETIEIEKELLKQKAPKDLTLLDAEIEKAKEAIKHLEVELGIKKIQKEEHLIAVEKGKRDIELSNQSVINAKAQFEQIVSQKLFTDRQIKGFDDNIKMNLLSTQLKNWAFMFSSGLLTDDEGNSAVPDIIRNDEVSKLYKDVLSSICCSSDDYCSKTSGYFVSKDYCKTDIFKNGMCEALFEFENSLKSKD